ncbi:MAG: tRNA uridine-5-carboxymethylaminomethyl(34) synthesis GTPase MnmE [Gammaproteobacteria bacterium]|nr:tRNA uridine-5-carboxymethylaminomethyl(34) synthesis GTPase MnmE [Gammaproteobacteria bacterium]
MNTSTTTIAAPVTPPGCGGVGIVRVSGPLTTTIAKAVLGKVPRPRYATFCKFFAENKSIIDEGVALYFSAPNSFTGEDVLELQGHGGQVILDCVLQRVLSLGAIMARPGEFSERAFLNGKIDLTQAEAIVDLVNATTALGARNAMRSLQGEFSARIHSLVEQLIKLRTQIEAAIDFPEEELELLADGKIAEALTKLLTELKIIENTAQEGVVLREGITVVIAGKPNAGKSSLLNQLCGRDAAIVTPIPGTTRDIIRSFIQLDGLPIHLLDTAGLRDNPDTIESEGIARAWQEIKNADHLLVIVDGAAEKLRDPKKIVSEFASVMPEHAKITVVYNKIDLTFEAPQIKKQEQITSVYLAAKTGVGLDLLKKHLIASAGICDGSGGFSARRRHLEALRHAYDAILAATYVLKQNSLELVAEELTSAQKFLGTITGEFTSDDLLARIFSEFCLGK